jgi:hypothetical protein
MAQQCRAIEGDVEGWRRPDAYSRKTICRVHLPVDAAHIALQQ